MVICKFFQQGNCKFGNRCRNEHDRGPEGGFSGHNRGEQQSGFGRNQNYRNDYQYQERGQNDYGRSRPQQRHTQEKKQNDYASPFARNNNQQQRQQGNQDRFHWNKNQGNRFGALANEPTDNNFASGSGQTEDDAIVKAIQDDMKTWVESKMWPYSCYFHPKSKKCVEGLPDIQPEELRVLYLLHGDQTYKNLIQQVDSMYNKRKDDLFIMMDDIKQSILSDLHNSVESNPSSCLSIFSMYGTGVDFKNKNESSGLSTQSQDKQETTQQPSAANVASPTTALQAKTEPSTKPSSEASPQGGAVANIFKNPPPVSAAPQADDTRYTDRSLLSAEELKQFESERFTAGEIPMRPPPKEMCR